MVTAIQNGLVCSKALANPGQGLNNSQPQLFALLILIHHDVLDVSHCSQTPQELLLHEHGPSTNHLIVRLGNDNDGKVYLVGFDPLTSICLSGDRTK